MATLVQMRTSLRRKLGNVPTAQVADSVLTEHLNTAYVDIMTTMNHKWGRTRSTFNTVAGTAAYTVANAIVLVVWDRTHNVKLNKLDEVDRVTRDTSTSDSTVRGIPIEYETYQDSITLYPTPDAIYAMEAIIRRVPADLSADGDTPSLNSSWHPGIVLLGRFYYYDDTQDAAKATWSWNQYQLWLQRRQTDIEQENDDRETPGVRLPFLTNNLYPRLDFDHGG